MSKLEINLFGAPEVRLDGQRLNLRRRKSEGLLAFLVLTDQPQRREKLAVLFWPDAPQSKAYTYLRRSISALRQTLGSERISTDNGLVEFNAIDLQLDVAEFRTLLARATSHPSLAMKEKSDLLRKAIRLRRDEFMAGFTLPDCLEFDEWQFFLRQELDRSLIIALDDLIESLVIENDFETAIPLARDRLALDPLDEDAQRALMRLYAWDGQWAAARRQFDVCTQLIKTELDLLPMDETLQLHQAILHKSLPHPDPIAHSTMSQADTQRQPWLRATLTPLIGRTAEIDALSALLTAPDVRLVTLFGAGGIGKSRLALAIADQLSRKYEDGVCFVEMAALQSHDQLPSAIIDGLNLPQATHLSTIQQLTNYLCHRKLLLVLDNFEHLSSAASTVVQLLEDAPGMTVLTTSRARLNVRGEQIYPLAGLPLPNEEDEVESSTSDSVRLFVHQAKQQQPDFHLTAENIQAVNRICHLVQGMPLGILLAAGWVELLSIQEIAKRIASSLDFLESDLQDLPERQRSLRAVFASTWSLLTTTEREVFPRLSVFRGGWTASAVEAVAGLTIHDLRRLSDKSLIQRVAPDRFTVHELLRQYAAEMLARSPSDERATEESHARFYTDFLAKETPMMYGEHHLRTLVRIDLERENLRAAWHWATEQCQIDLLNRSVEGLCLFYRFRGYIDDGLSACQRASSRLAAFSRDETNRTDVLTLTARLHLWQGIFHRERGDDRAEMHWEQARAIIDAPALVTYDSRQLRADLCFHRGIAAVRLCDYDSALALYATGEELYRALNLPRELADLLLEKAIVYWHRNLYNEANELNQEAMEIFRQLGDNGGISDSLMGLGLCANGLGNYQDAVTYFRRCVKLATETSGDRIYVATVRNLLGFTLLNTGEFAESLELSLSSVAIADELGNRYWASMYQWIAGTAQIHLGDYEDAEQILSTALGHAKAINFVRGISAITMLLSKAALAMQHCERAKTFAEESVEAARTIDHPDELARSLSILAVVHLSLGNVDQGHRSLRESLQLADRVGAYFAMVALLPACVLYFIDKNQSAEAHTYHMLALGEPFWCESQWYASVVGRQLTRTTGRLPVRAHGTVDEQAQQQLLRQAIADLLTELDDQVAVPDSTSTSN